MRQRFILRESLGQHCFQACYLAFLGVTLVAVAGAAAGTARADEAAQVLMNVVRFGFAGIAGLFVVGVACSVIQRNHNTGSRGPLP